MQDQQTRLAAFDWLTRQVEIHGDVLPWALLAWGFEYQGARVPVVSQQGIFKPRVMEYPLSMRTSANSPYDDSFGPDGLLRYRYRGTDPNHRDNVGLREAMRRQLPLAYFHAVLKGRYLAIWPTYIVGDDPKALTFSVAVDDASATIDLSDRSGLDSDLAEDSTARRKYITVAVRQRVHQRAFRERVLRAYREQCAFCRLKHRELLEASHIVPDADEGPPQVRNGVALCKLHHAAFDALFVAIRPDMHIEVRSDILLESDGPMLIHGLQDLHGKGMSLPRSAAQRPDPDLLTHRYERFLAATR